MVGETTETQKVADMSYEHHTKIELDQATKGELLITSIFIYLFSFFLSFRHDINSLAWM